MVTIKRLSDCSLEEAIQAYNSSFGDYYIPQQINVDQFAALIVNGRMSPELSIVAFVDGQPVGFTLNGIQIRDGERMARNGSTGVAAPYRRSGIGKQLMGKTMEIYKQEDVDVAVLEAFSVNKKAIALYEKFGYEVIERLLFLERISALESNPFLLPEDPHYQAEYGILRDAGILPFYNSNIPWQNHWENIVDGESLLIRSQEGEAIGYALYKRSLKPSGELAAITLFQCEAAPERQDHEAIMRFALSHVFAPYDVYCKRTTFNLPDTNEGLIKILREAGFVQAFTESNVLLEQVHMYRVMK